MKFWLIIFIFSFLYQNIKGQVVESKNEHRDSKTIKHSQVIKQVECKSDTTIALCPYCKSKRKVLPIEPGLIVNYNFGNNNKAINRYDRKRERQGYELYNDSGKVVVIGVWIPNEKEKFWDFQHCFFCLKCEKVF